MNEIDPTQTFLLEAEDLLTQIEEIALDLGRRADDPDAVNRLFRAFHTIKGSGAMFGFDRVAEFTHHVETVLDQVREGRVHITDSLLALILSARDQIKALLEGAADPATDADGAAIIAALSALTTAPATAANIAPTAPPLTESASATWEISFRPSPDILLTGLDPASLLQELQGLGDCQVTADVSRVPTLDTLAHEKCHLAWTIRLTTSRGLNAIQDVFIFVADESQLSITPASVSAAPVPAAPVPAAHVITPPPAEPVETRRTPAAGTKSNAKDATVRVPSTKLDRLISLVGELVMNQSRLVQVSARLDDAQLAQPVEAIERLVGELRDSVLSIRMMPIGSTFSRFKRLVHDLSRELGKEIDLVTEGAETEMDKHMLDQLGDPLVHLIRNSLDHGIESPADRQRSGKPALGTIRLSATHAGSHVVITIQDNGRGIDVEAVRAKAIEKGLISSEAALSEKETFNLIFLPGFSTAKQVTSVSGRGVGMDVVKKQLDALRGTIQIASTRGAGTTISLSLPLTLAIIDGLLIEVAGDPFIVPMSAVTENVELAAVERTRHNGRKTVTVRGELIPYVRLREIFGVNEEAPATEKVVLVRHEDQRVGLAVDRVLGNHQTVIQSLGAFCRHIEVCSGATIMGDGRVALILDVPGLLRRAGDGAHRNIRCAA